MANIKDYIKWRGDLSMQVDPFNDIDGLILSELVYVEFAGIVPAFPTNQSCLLKDAASDFFKLNDEEKLLSELSFTKESIELLKLMATSTRYQNILLSNYLNELDYQETKQFAAITFQLPDSSIYIAYRGTDDTILGWKEDFTMTYMMPIPSQIRAVEYLKTVTKQNFNQSLITMFKHKDYQTNYFKIAYQYFYQLFNGVKIRIGGHSKGGNLAVYAALHVNKKITKRIIEIYNNDGPGFNQDILNLPDYQKIAKRIKKFIPEGSVFGIMLECLEERIVVKSDAKGLMQHSGFTWQVEGTTFVKCEEINQDSQAMDVAFKAWLSKVDLETRENAVNSFFGIIEACKIERINDFSEKSFTHFMAALKEIKNMDSDSRNALIHFFKTLILENTISRKESKKK